ncbi:MAG TPA: hypothetical protein VHY35_17495 [Stellaceae bacterium]|jgi:hypothetical protein|nr:hypothetical protein [Stellaceae bacterium]
MNHAAKRLPIETKAAHSSIARSSVDREIRDFLSGKTHGESLLHQLYDHVLDEPVPAHLRAVLRDAS